MKTIFFKLIMCINCTALSSLYQDVAEAYSNSCSNLCTA